MCTCTCSEAGPWGGRLAKQPRAGDGPSERTGTLYVVPTPIGNLDDITIRAIRVLGQVSAIAAEDTRRSRILLTHHGIRARLISYHQHTKTSGAGRVLSALEQGDVALISDAGMPSLSDPGFELIREALGQGFRVEVLPGPSAVTVASTLAALPARGFIFMGFLPRAHRELTDRLREVASLPYNLVLFESPRRVRATIRALLEVLGDREAVAARELTKRHEETVRGRLTDLAAHLDTVEPRGEWTLVVGASPGPAQAPASDEDVATAVGHLLAKGETLREAVRTVAEELAVSRSRVYRLALESGERS